MLKISSGKDCSRMGSCSMRLSVSRDCVYQACRCTPVVRNCTTSCGCLQTAMMDRHPLLQLEAICRDVSCICPSEEPNFHTPTWQMTSPANPAHRCCAQWHFILKSQLQIVPGGAGESAVLTQLAINCRSCTLCSTGVASDYDIGTPSYTCCPCLPSVFT